MVTHDEVREALRGVLDPEMPISIVDLGLVEHIDISGPDIAGSHDPAPAASGAAVRVDILPTFVGCPALDMIRDEIRTKVGAIDGVSNVVVRFLNDPPWSTERITPAGRAALREFGVSTPDAGGQSSTAATSVSRPVTLTTPADHASGEAASLLDGRGSDDAAVPCPYCDSLETTLESRFGPTRCKMIYYCRACRNSFERLKRV